MGYSFMKSLESQNLRINLKEDDPKSRSLSSSFSTTNNKSDVVNIVHSTVCTHNDASLENLNEKGNQSSTYSHEHPQPDFDNEDRKTVQALKEDEFEPYDIEMMDTTDDKTRTEHIPNYDKGEGSSGNTYGNTSINANENLEEIVQGSYQRAPSGIQGQIHGNDKFLNRMHFSDNSVPAEEIIHENQSRT